MRVSSEGCESEPISGHQCYNDKSEPISPRFIITYSAINPRVNPEVATKLLLYFPQINE